MTDTPLTTPPAEWRRHVASLTAAIEHRDAAMAAMEAQLARMAQATGTPAPIVLRPGDDPYAPLERGGDVDLLPQVYAWPRAAWYRGGTIRLNGATVVAPKGLLRRTGDFDRVVVQGPGTLLATGRDDEGASAVYVLGRGNLVRVAGVHVDGFREGVTVQGEEAHVRRMEVVGCRILNSWSSRRSQAIYHDNVGSWEVVNSVFDHNGWREAAGISPYMSSQNHDIYAQVGSGWGVVQDCVFSRGCADSVQLRPGGKLIGCLFDEMPMSATVDRGRGEVRGNIIARSVEDPKGRQLLEGLHIGDAWHHHSGVTGATVSDNWFVLGSPTAARRPPIRQSRVSQKVEVSGNRQDGSWEAVDGVETVEVDAEAVRAALADVLPLAVAGEMGAAEAIQAVRGAIK